MSHPRPSGSSGLPRRVARASNSTPIGQFATRPVDTSQTRSPRPQGASTVTSSALALQHVPDPSQMDLARGSDRRSVGSGRSHHEEVAPPVSAVRTPSPLATNLSLHDPIHASLFDQPLRQTIVPEDRPHCSTHVDDDGTSTASSRRAAHAQHAERHSQGFSRSSPAQDQDATNRRIVDRATQTLAMMQQCIEATAGDAGVYDMRDIVDSIIRESEMYSSRIPQSVRSSPAAEPSS